MRDLMAKRVTPAATLTGGLALALVMAIAGTFGAVRAAGAQPPATDYIIGPRDVLAVTVLNEPTLSGRFTVVSDGTFTYPLLGAVRVGGLSVRAVERELVTKLADGYLEKPVVTVALDQFGSQRVLIVGEVKQPASYPLTGRTTVLEALLGAGATTATAGVEALVVRGKNPPTHVDLEALQRGDLSQNVTLEPGDMVFVPRAEPQTPVYVMGQVRTPGAYQLPRGATVLQALAQAGGVTDQGSTRRVTVVRKLQGKSTELKAALEDALLPGDTVVVRRRLF